VSFFATLIAAGRRLRELGAERGPAYARQALLLLLSWHRHISVRRSRNSPA
jgi:hypothetical protein